MSINPRNITIPSFIIYPNFRHCYSLFQEQTSLPILACGAHFQFNNHDFLKMLIGIKSLNTKQLSARLSPPPVILSSFIGR